MSSASQNLKGVRVLDLGRVLAGPWATQNLADLGADVIKVEKPRAGDDTRHWGPPFVGDTAAYYFSANRGKRSIEVDISKEEGQEITKKLAATSDVFIENFRVGGLAQFGLCYDDIKAVNPQIIYCSISGFGQTGEYADKPGYDYMIQAMGGLMSITGEPNQPMKVGVPIADLMTGMYATVAILAALNARHSTGEGQYIDLSLFDVQLAMLANQASNYLVSGDVPQAMGSGHPNIVPYQSFASATDPFIVAVGNDKQFENFCSVIGLEDLSTHELYKTNGARVVNREKLVELIQDVLRGKSAEHWIAQCEAANVPCSVINTVEQALHHPQAKHRNMTMTTDYDGESVDLVCSPLVQNADAQAPTLGQHTDEVLSQILGLSDDEIAELKTKDIV